MSQFQGTFKRYEKKYLLNARSYKLIRKALEEKMEVDAYGKTTICNIYFDTPNRQLIRNSIEKPVYKEKLRLRSYGTPSSKEETTFVELKKKYKGVVYKRRERMPLWEAENYLYEGGELSYTTQITREIDWFKKFYKGLEPAMYISYDRIALYGKEDTELRITFDSNILWREEDFWLSAGTWGNAILESGQHLMEIKIAGAMPIWLSKLLTDLNIYPVSFSKYGRAYITTETIKEMENRIIMENKKGMVKYA